MKYERQIKTISSTNDEKSITISDDIATAWFYGNVYAVNTMHDLTLKEDNSAFFNLSILPPTYQYFNINR